MKKLTLEKKVDMIFSYLFGEEGIQKEEDFWDTLTDTELKEIKNIKKEKSFTMEELKKELCLE